MPHVLASRVWIRRGGTVPSKWSCKMGQCVSAFRASLLERAAETSAGWWPIPPCLRTPSQQRHLPAARSHMRSSTISRCCLTSPPAQVRRIPVLPPRHPACLGLPARGQDSTDPVSCPAPALHCCFAAPACCWHQGSCLCTVSRSHRPPRLWLSCSRSGALCVGWPIKAAPLCRRCCHCCLVPQPVPFSPL